MRVLVDLSAIPARPAGAGTYVLRLVEALGRRPAPRPTGGPDPDRDPDRDLALTLVARRDDGDRWRALAPGASLAAVAPNRRPTRLAWEQVCGPWTARRQGAQVWHGPHYTMPLALPSLPRHTPAVVTVHDLTFFDHPEWHERSKVRYFRAMIRASARRAAVLVCVSQTTADRLQSILAPRVPVVVAPHGIDADRFRPATDPGIDAGADDAVLAGLGIRAPFVAFVGTVEPRKNIVGLLRAMEGLPAGTTLVLAGQDGWATNEVDAAVARCTRPVVRLGYVADRVVPVLYRRAAVVAYPALAEGFGLPALEALACGARLVTTAATSMEEIAGDAALLVPAGDDEALAGALARALAGEGPDPAAGPGIAARFTWEASAERHLEAYRLALG
jgi:glycosyltransferase involved in cell wall biosynthesis